jgi:hypothetical protein
MIFRTSSPTTTPIATRRHIKTSHALGCECNMTNKRNVVLYLDEELVKKARELGFNLSKTFENHLKQLINSFSNVNSLNKGNSICFVGNSR